MNEQIILCNPQSDVHIPAGLTRLAGVTNDEVRSLLLVFLGCVLFLGMILLNYGTRELVFLVYIGVCLRECILP
jgi:hypothetical protein